MYILCVTWLCYVCYVLQYITVPFRCEEMNHSIVHIVNCIVLVIKILVILLLDQFYCSGLAVSDNGYHSMVWGFKPQ